jgi:hypothetical protein
LHGPLTAAIKVLFHFTGCDLPQGTVQSVKAKLVCTFQGFSECVSLNSSSVLGTANQAPPTDSNDRMGFSNIIERAAHELRQKQNSEGGLLQTESL